MAGVSSNKISIVIDGTSKELQAAIDAALKSLEALNKTTLEVATQSLEMNERIIASNAELTESYVRLSEVVTMGARESTAAVRAQATAWNRAASAAKESATAQTEAFDKLAETAMGASDEIAGAVDRQVDAFEEATLKIDDSAKLQTDAMKEIAVAAKESAVVVDEAAAAQTGAQEKVAEGAAASADEVTAAAGKQATASKTAADASVGSAARTSSAVKSSSDKQVAAFGASGSGLVKLGKLTTEAGAAVAAGSLYMSAKFEASTTRLVTQAGAAESQLKQMRSGLLSMAGEVGQTPNELSDALYHVVSSMNKVLPAATRTNEELKITKIAMEGAAIGGTNAQETAYALASAMNALHQHAGDAQKTMALLNAVVGSGDMTMNDLLAALKSGLIPTAQTFGISLQSVGAALAVMGDQGMRGALAGTRLRMALSLMASPSEAAAKMLDALGLSAGEVKARTQGMSEALEKAHLSTTTMAADLRQPDGIVVALKDLQDHLKASGLNAEQSAAVFGRAFGGGRMSASIELLANSVDRVGIKYKQIGNQIGDFGSDWEKTQHTLTFQAHQAEGAVAALGTKIGEDLTPLAEHAMHGLEDMAKWLTENKLAAEALAATITGVLGVAMAAFIANRARKMVDGLKEIGAASAWLKNGFSSAAPVAGAEAAAATTAEVGGAEAAGSTSVLSRFASQGAGAMLGGARSGYGLPGSMVNPLIVAIESGQYAGLGGEAAASGAVSGSEGEVKAAAGEAAGGETAGAETLAAAELGKVEATATAAPAALEKAAPEAVSVAPAVEGGVKTVLGTAMDGLLKGGMVAAAGTIGSQIAGSVIGGKTGKDVSSIGTDASLGAAIGTVIEPGIGTAIGGGLGAIAGSLKLLMGGGKSDAEQKAETDIKKLSKVEYNQEVSKILEGEIKKIWEHADNQLKKLPNHPGQINRSPTEADDTKKRAAIQKHAERKVGDQEAYALSQELTTGALPSFNEVKNKSKELLSSLGQSGKEGAINYITTMVQTLEKEGKLNPKSIDPIMESLKSELVGIAGTTGKTTGAALAAGIEGAINLSATETKLREATTAMSRTWKAEFGLFPTNTHESMEEVLATVTSDMRTLEYQMKNGTKYARTQASAEYKELSPEIDNFIKQSSPHLGEELTNLGKSNKPASAKAVQELAGPWAALPAGTKTYLEDTNAEVKKGAEKLTEAVQSEEKQLFGKAGAVLTGSTHAPEKTKGSTPKKTYGVSGELAGGGLIQLGRPGEAGRDSIPMSVGGTDFVAAPGEKVAVINRHQEKVANQYMAPIGGLPGLFSSVKTPNYMAGGGYVYGKPELESLWDEAGGSPSKAALMAAIALAESSGRPNAKSTYDDGGSYAEGLWQIEMPLHISQVPGGDAFNPLDNARGAVAILNSQGLGAWETYTKGAYLKFLGAGGAEVATGKTGAALKVPTINAEGAVGEMAQLALQKLAEAADEAFEGAGATITGGPTGVAGTSVAGQAVGAGTAIPSAPWNPAHKPIAKWIVPVLEWAHGHGWDGTITSGYRTRAEQEYLYAHKGQGGISTIVALPGTSNHEKMAYPGGAVDVDGGSDAQLIEMMRGYNGPQKLQGGNLGPADPYHFSEDGRAMGGFLPGFAGGTDDVAKAASKSGLGPSTIVIKPPPKSKPAKGHDTKGKSKHTNLHTTAKTHPSAPLVKLRGLRGLEKLAETIKPFETKLNAYSDLTSLFNTIEGGENAQVVSEDMQYLRGLASTQNVAVGMSIGDAYKAYERQIVKEGETEQLKEEGEYLKWAEGQANHHILTEAQRGDLMPAAVLAGMGHDEFPPGQPVKAYAEQIKKNEVSLLEGQDSAASKVIGTLQQQLAWRKGKEHRLEKEKMAEKKRSEFIKGELQKLKTGTVKAKYAAAVDAVTTEEDVYQAELHKAAIEETPYKERTKGQEDSLASIKKYIVARKEPVRAKTEAERRAYVSVLENKMKDELTPLTKSLSEIEGSKPLISISGLVSEIEKIKTGTEAVETAISEDTDSKVPAGKLELAKIQQELVQAEVPHKIPSTAENNTALLEAEKAENALLSTELAVSTNQFGVLSNFIANLPKMAAGGVVVDIGDVPHYEKGGPVLEDGLAMVHKGEHVVPANGTLVATGGMPPINIEQHTHLHGNSAALIDLIDSRVTHPENVRAISRYQGQRVQGFPGYARSR